MSLRRHLTRDGIAHANADSDTHERHVSQRAARRTIEWVPATAKSNAAAEFRLQADDLEIGNGVYYIGHGDNERSVCGPEFEAACAAVNWQRSWNTAEMQRRVKVPAGTPGSKDGILLKTSTVRRKRKHPACEEFIINFAPWQMEFLNRQLDFWKKAEVSSNDRKDLLKAWLEKLRPPLVTHFESESQRSIIGSYIHLDSNKIHFGVVHSRVGPANTLVGKKVLQTVGPWSTAQARVSELGLADAADHRLTDNLDKFQARHGKDVQPLDIALHNKLDTLFESLVNVLGVDAHERYAASKEHYCKWKLSNRRESVLRSSTSETVAHETLRLLLPLMPPNVRDAVTITRTGIEALRVVTGFLKAIQTPVAGIGEIPKPQPEKAK